jgi:hypothetical protein
MVAPAKDPDCAGPGNPPATSALVAIKDTRFLETGQPNFSRTIVMQIASQWVGKDLWHQVQLVQYCAKSGASLQVVAVNRCFQRGMFHGPKRLSFLRSYRFRGLKYPAAPIRTRAEEFPRVAHRAVWMGARHLESTGCPAIDAGKRDWRSRVHTEAV